MKNLTFTFLAVLLSFGAFAVGSISGTLSVCQGSTRTLTDATTGGYWFSSNASVASIGSGTGVVNGVSAGVVTITYYAGSSGTAYASFTVNATPAPITGTTSVTVGSTTTLFDALTGGTWTTGGSTIASVGSLSGIVTGVSPGVSGVYYIVSGCAAYTSVTVTAASSVAPITGTTTACIGNTRTLADATSGGSWTSGNTAIATVGATSGIVTAIAAGTVTITYHVGTAIATTTFTVNPNPAPISGITTVAVGSTTTLFDALTGGTWTTGSSSIASVGTATGVVSGVSPGVSGVYYIVGGCAAYTSVTVTAAVSVAPITGTTTACVGNTRTLADATSGGSWTSSNTAIANVGATSGIVTAIAAGVATITYSVGTAIATTTFTVNPNPAPISGITTVAVGSTTTLFDATTGGTWTTGSSTIASVGTGTGVVSGVSPGVSGVYYIVGGCAAYTSVTVTATSSVAPITGTSTACVGNTRTLADATSGGSWTSSNTAIATVGATSGIVTAITAGTVTITYHVGTAIATTTFTVNPTPAPITGITTVAVGSTTTLFDATSGGTWTTGSSSIASVGTATGIVSGIAPGVSGVYYIVGGCAAYTSVTVTPAVTVAPITGTTTACIGNTRTLADATSGGSWTSSNTSIATVGATSGIVTAIAAGTVTITYSVGTAMVTTTFTVNPTPAPITGITTVAVGSTTTFFDATTGGTWTCGGTSVATIGSLSGIVTGVSPGVSGVYYVVGGCGAYTSVTVTPAVTIAPITGTFTTCVGSTRTLADATSGGTWSSSNSSVATIGLTTGIVTGVAAGTVTITYRVGTSMVTTTFTVSPAPAAITGITSVAVGSTTTLFDAVTGGTWTTGGTSIATVGSSSGIVTGIAPGVTSVYYVIGGCGAYTSVTVTPAAVTIAPITGTLSACIGSSRTLADATPGGTWSSSSTLIATIGSTTGIVTGVSTGTVFITYRIGASFVFASFSVMPAPAPITGITTVAVGAVTTLFDAVSGGSWTSGGTSIATIGSSTGIVYGVSPGVSGIYYVIGGCGAYTSVTVTAATSTIAPITGTASTCVGTTRTLADATSGGLWSSSNVSRATVGSTTGLVMGISAGTLTITYSIGSSYVTTTFTVNPTPAAITGTLSTTVGGTTTLASTTTGGVWTSGNPSVATVGSATGIVTGVAAGTCGIYYVVGGCGVYATITVTSSTSVAPITGTMSVCLGSTRTLADATTGGTWSSSNTSIATVGITTGVVSGITAGTVTITYRVGTTFVTTAFTVNPPPAAIAGSSIVYAGSTITLTSATSGGTWISSGVSTAPVGSTSGIVSGIAPGVVTIYYIVGGCGAYKSVTVMPVSTGGGSIAGFVTSGSAKGTSGAPVVGMNIELMDADNNIAMTSTSTDATGYYAFTSLADGNYVVYPTESGYTTTPSAVITLSGAASTANNVNFKKSTTSMTISTVSATAVSATVSNEMLNVFPNPTSGILSINWEHATPTAASIIITDVTGREVYKTSIDITNASGTAQINISELRNGLYLISIKADDINYSGKLVMQK